MHHCRLKSIYFICEIKILFQMSIRCSDDPEHLATVLRYIHEKYPEVEVELIDPRNFFYFWYVAKHHIKVVKRLGFTTGVKYSKGYRPLRK